MSLYKIGDSLNVKLFKTLSPEQLGTHINHWISENINLELLI